MCRKRAPSGEKYMNEPQNVKFKPGKILDGKWIIIELIGKGAMGEVYRAHQTNLKRDVAIKIISDDVMSEIADDPEELDIAFGRFQREVQTMAQVRHINVLTIYDYGEIKESDGTGESRTAYIVMEFIPGNSLRFTLSEDGLDDVPELYGEWVRDYFMPLLDGVEILHINKIIHRDLKPENIFLDGDIPKIADFGLARSQQIKAVTCSIEMLGTLAYMSPEQCADFKYAGYTTDIYALGKILFEAVNGTLTKKAVPFTSVCINNPQTDFLKEMSKIIKRATAEKPSDRYQTVQELRTDLQRSLLRFSGEYNGEPADAHTKNHISKMVSDKQIKIFAIGIIIVIALIVAADFYDYFYMTDSTPGLDETVYTETSEKPDYRHIVVAEGNSVLAETILGKDGSRLILTGDVQSTTEEKFLFYMDNRKITNFLFLEFLHNVKEEITVKNGIVRHGGKIVIYIGDGSAAEDNIIFEHDSFHLKNQDDGSKPVSRVTYHGAQMYAIQYGKELLTDKEWQYGYRYHLANLAQKKTVEPEIERKDDFNMMMHNTSFAPERPNDQIVLDNMGQTFKEWVSLIPSAEGDAPVSSKDATPISGVMDSSRVDQGGQPLIRFPWEGFDDVGFRTKIPVVKK